MPKTPAPAAMDSKRFVFIDALRGLAALAVIYLHMTGHLNGELNVARGWEADVMYFFRRVVDLGKVGVVVFFAISGFVIPFTLLKGGVAPVRNFVVNRFFRLYPAYWLSLILGVIFVWWMQGKTLTVKMVMMNITMLQQFVGVENVLGLYWTLQIELIFYALCVGMFLAGLLQRRRVVFATALAFLGIASLLAVTRYEMNMKLPVALALALAFMFWGCVWRDYVLKGEKEAKKLGLIFMAIFAVAMPGISLLAYNTDMGFDETWYRYLLSYYAAAAVLLVFTTKVRFEASVFAWLGRISYSVYLLGSIVIALVMRFLPFNPESGLPAHAYIALIMLLSVWAADTCYRLVEAPMIKAGRALNARWNKKPGEFPI